MASDRVRHVPLTRSFMRPRRSRPVSVSRYLDAFRRVVEDLAVSLKELHIIVLVNEGSSLEGDLQQTHDTGDVELIGVQGDGAAVASMLKRRARADVIVDATSQGDRLRLFRDIFWALKDGGRYVALDAGSHWSRGLDALLQPLDSGTVAAERKRRELIDSVAGYGSTAHRRDRTVVKRFEHHAVLRHSDVERRALRQAWRQAAPQGGRGSACGICRLARPAGAWRRICRHFAGLRIRPLGPDAVSVYR